MSEPQRVGKRVEIDNIHYTIYKFPLKLSCDNIDLLLQIFGEPIISMLTDLLKNKSAPKGNIKESLGAFSKNIKIGNTNQIFQTILNPDFIKSSGDGKFNVEDTFDKKGFKHLVQLLLEVIKENYLDFLF